MKLKTHSIFLLILLIGVGIIACDQSANTEETAKTEPAKTETPSIPAYDAAMDPINVEAKFLKMHKDTLGIKLYEVTLNPGDSVGIHNHPDHVIYFAQGGKLRLYAKDGKSEDVEIPTGAAILSAAISHYGLNIGATTVKMIVTDIYRPRS